jgi:ubiquinone/menaquinone biosynthesis C-methylase UbiE
MSAEQLRDEADRILARYARRDDLQGSHFQQYRDIARHERHRVYRGMLDRLLASPLEQAVVLDIGCGEGDELEWMATLGVHQSRLAGVDLRPDVVEVAARKLGPKASLYTGDACVIDLGGKTFDIIICNIVFSSILNPAVRRSLADRIMRLLGPEGVLLWTDFTFNNPRNADVLRVSRTDVCNLFPNFEPHLLRRHLAPPLARTVLRGGSAGRMLYSMLNVVPLLRTHLIGGLQPRRVPEAGELSTCTSH